MGEIWKDIYYVDIVTGEVHDYRGYYQVSNKGHVKSLDRITIRNQPVKGRIMAHKVDKDGYHEMALSKDGKIRYYRAHRLVAYMFIENDDPTNKIKVNHKNQVRDDNRVENLEWCTEEYNNNYGDKGERIRKRLLGHKHSQETIDKYFKLPTRERVKAVIGVHMENDSVLYFENLGVALKNGFMKTSISNCCKGRKANYKGYEWYYVEEYSKKYMNL